MTITNNCGLNAEPWCMPMFYLKTATIIISCSNNCFCTCILPIPTILPLTTYALPIVSLTVQPYLQGSLVWQTDWQTTLLSR